MTNQVYTLVVYWDKENPKTYTFADYKTAKMLMETARESGYFATITF